MFGAVVHLCSRVGECQRKRQELGQLREKVRAPTSIAVRYRISCAATRLMLLRQLEIGQSRP